MELVLILNLSCKVLAKLFNNQPNYLVQTVQIQSQDQAQNKKRRIYKVMHLLARWARLCHLRRTVMGCSKVISKYGEIIGRVWKGSVRIVGLSRKSKKKI